MNPRTVSVVVACTLFGLSACAPVTAGGPPLALSPERAAASHVDSLYASSTWVFTEEGFTDAVTAEVLTELAACARGPAAMTLKIHIEEAHVEDRAWRGGVHRIGGTAEFVDPKTKAVVGRYPFRVAVDSRGGAQSVLVEPSMLLGQEVGRTLCREAFGAGG